MKISVFNPFFLNFPPFFVHLFVIRFICMTSVDVYIWRQQDKYRRSIPSYSLGCKFIFSFRLLHAEHISGTIYRLGHSNKISSFFFLYFLQDLFFSSTHPRRTYFPISEKNNCDFFHFLRHRCKPFLLVEA